MTPLCMKIMDGFATSFWLKRDPVDALADAEALARALREHCDNVLQRSMIEAVKSPDPVVMQNQLMRWR